MIVSKNDNRAHQTDENYLKTIFVLQTRQGTATPADLERELNSSTSTVYHVVNKLEAEGHIISVKGTRGKKPSIELTESGRLIAENMFQRHQKIHNWLMLLGTAPELAEAEACMLEHGLSDMTMEIISRHVDMATGSFGEDAAYPEKMKRMAMAMQNTQTKRTGLTETDKIMDAIGSHGGYETLIKESELVKKYGGASKITQTMTELEELGGIEKLKIKLENINKLGGLEHISQTLEAVNLLGGLANLLETHEEIEKIGGISKLKRTVELYENYAEPKKIKEINAKLYYLDSMGGMKEINRKLNVIEKYGGTEKIAETYKKLEKIQRLISEN